MNEQVGRVTNETRTEEPTTFNFATIGGGDIEQKKEKEKQKGDDESTGD